MLTYGMDNLCSAGTVGFAQPDILQKYIYLCQDNLLRLAEGLGGMWLDIPSAPDWCRFSATRTNDILTHIDSAVGVTIDFPNPFPGEYGLKTDRGVCCFRSISAIYLAFRVSQLCRGIENPRVLEIGPGVGRSVYYAHRLGIEDYTCVDLPFPAGVVQSYYLMRTLGSEKVQLLGENADESKIRIIDPETFYAGTGYYDLIVNMDSLTEVGSPVAKKYWDMISRSCSKFLSINHESNGYRIRDMAMSSSVSGYTRHPDWLHPGYVEELVEFKHY
ncbi:putative sugar O-methyltransferase [Methylocystis sp. MJC1]|jgi:hypothetical protein|nr:putative sugar O-methyltransferase [Methylocystis sp. MJC1]KAF2989725.1 hypothetical protein MJC1_03070 [Methylocystis sp. MJC1]MBU6526386.1 putative sugar O-methyltransferase [Methylocystis sp. MJC1]UZX12833.1 putative sugar O-methyltransferase [Methylocystis sp. MJC1]